MEAIGAALQRPSVSAIPDTTDGVRAMQTEKIRVRVNGSRHGMFVIGDDLSRPVLLFVHGGPGMPEYWLTQRRPVAFEEIFTVAWWNSAAPGSRTTLTSRRMR